MTGEKKIEGVEQPVNACTQCHNDAPVPEGWLTTSQANRLKK